MRIEDKTIAQLREMLEELEIEEARDQSDLGSVKHNLERLSNRGRIRKAQIARIRDELQRRPAI